MLAYIISSKQQDKYCMVVIKNRTIFIRIYFLHNVVINIEWTINLLVFNINGCDPFYKFTMCLLLILHICIPLKKHHWDKPNVCTSVILNCAYEVKKVYKIKFTLLVTTYISNITIVYVAMYVGSVDNFLTNTNVY